MNFIGCDCAEQYRQAAKTATKSVNFFMRMIFVKRRKDTMKSGKFKIKMSLLFYYFCRRKKTKISAYEKNRPLSDSHCDCSAAAVLYQQTGI